LLFRLQSLWNLGNKNSSGLTPPAYDWLVNVPERILSLLLIWRRNGHGPTLNAYHIIAIQPDYWRVGRIYRKHSFLYCCVI
jgi:hypothetical protein